MSMFDENIIAVTNRKLVRGDFLRQIEKVYQAGVKKLILREKDVSPEEYVSLALKVQEISFKYHAHLIWHFFVKEAAEQGAKYIHLPLDRACQYKTYLKNFKKVGVSTHSMAQVKEAEALGAAYVTFGHVFETDCKKGIAPKGIEVLRQVCRDSKIPVYGLGGIHLNNRQQVLEAGAAGYCMMSECMGEDFELDTF